MATCFSILAWRIPRTEEPDGLQSMRSQSWTQMKRLSTQALSDVYGGLGWGLLPEMRQLGKPHVGQWHLDTQGNSPGCVVLTQSLGWSHGLTQLKAAGMRLMEAS